MRILLDTNVVGRLCQPEHVQFLVALAATEQLLVQGNELRLVPQVLYEFWAIATRPLTDNGFGFDVDQAQAELNRLKGVFAPLRDERGILEPWERLVVRHAVRGKTTHDARLVAAMIRHGVKNLLTIARRD